MDVVTNTSNSIDMEIDNENIENLNVSNVEQKNNGLSFEVVLNAAASPKPARVLTPKKGTPNIDNIKEKLIAAENRRRSMHDEQKSQIEARRAKEQQVRESKQEQEESFSKATEEKMKEKFVSYQEKYDARLGAIVERSKAYEEKVRKAQEVMTEMVKEQARAIQEKSEVKHGAAEARRNDLCQETLLRLKEHDKHVEEIRAQCSAMRGSSKSEATEACLHKIEVAVTNREAHLSEMHDRLVQHDKHAEEVRKNKQEISKTGSPRGYIAPGGQRTYWGTRRTEGDFRKEF